MTDLALRAAGASIGRPLSVVETLGGSDRSDVWRASDGERTVVVKAHSQEAESCWREPRGLRLAEPSGVAPRLLGSSADPPLVVMEDVGTGPSLADALLSRDPDRARWATRGWAEAVAALHVTTLGSDAELSWTLPEHVDTAVEALLAVTDELGVAADGLADLSVLCRILDARAIRVLSPGDVCPDNNAERDGRTMLFDFEFAELRHPAWDASYLRVPWPTCWCAWRVPDEVTGPALDHYRSLLAPAAPYVGTDAFDRDVDTASLVWCLLTTSWFLPAALGDDPAPRMSGAPRRRAMILHRLHLATALAGPDSLRAFADRLRGALVDRWGDVPLALAPAFR